MKLYREGRIRWFLIASLILLLAILLLMQQGEVMAPQSVEAQAWNPAQPGWRDPIAPPIAPDDALQYFGQQMRLAGESPLTDPPTSGEGAVDPATLPEVLPEVTPELEGLADGLDHDPVAIFNYVRNYTEHEPYYGQRRGPTLTLLDRKGNDFDTAALLVSLLRISGFNAKYVLGRMTLPTETVAAWLGIDPDFTLVSQWLNVAGIPYTNAGTQITMSRVWVWLWIDGVKYVLDPSLKRYERAPLTDLSALMGYDRDALLAAVSFGADITSDSIQNFNHAALREHLDTYTDTLADAVRESYMTTDLDTLLGGRTMVAEEVTELPTTLAFSAEVDYLLEEIPTPYNETLRIHGHGIDHTLRSFEFGGNRLTITFSEGDLRPQLRLDGALLAEGDPTAPGQTIGLTQYLDHPVAPLGGQYLDQERVSAIESGVGYTYALVYAIGTTHKVMDRAQRRLRAIRSTTSDETSEALRGQTLHIMGLTYARQYQLARQRLAQALGFRLIAHHYFGIMYQTDSAGVDWYGHMESTAPVTTQTTFKERLGVGYAADALASAFEHTTLEQTLTNDPVGYSTIRAIVKEVDDGGSVHYLNVDNIEALIPALAATYSTSKIAEFEAAVTGGSWLLIPQNGQQVVGELTGFGYIQSGVAGRGYFIEGNLNGGYGTSSDNSVDANNVAELSTEDPSTNSEYSSHTVKNPVAADPIDMQTGFFLVDEADIGIGPTLRFERSYNSGRSDVLGLVGHGWTHNLDISFSRTSRSYPALGTRGVLDMTALLVYSYVTADIYRALAGCGKTYCLTPEQDGLAHLLIVLGANWFTDSLTENSYVVRQGGQSHEFIRLPGGSFAAPPGQTSTLEVHADGSGEMHERLGPTLFFNNDGGLTHIRDKFGQDTVYEYDSSGRLSLVTEPYGRSLAFAYNATGLLNEVSDSTGRSVSYGYVDSDLTTVTDVAGETWTYGYEGHDLVTLTDPLGTTTATNTYDAQHRVVNQLVPRQSGETEYRFRYTEFVVSEESVVDGALTTYIFDDKGRQIGLRDALGHLATTKYDGQNQIVELTDALGAAGQFVYDQRNNRLETHDPDGGVTSTEVDSKNRVIQRTDATDGTASYTYDENDQVVAVSNANGDESFNAYDSKGRIIQNTNPLGSVSVCTYDQFGNQQSAQNEDFPPIGYTHDARGNLLALTDQLGQGLTFSYTARDQVSTITDARGKQTTFTYDALGRVASITNRNNQTITHSYDSAGNRDKVTYPDAGDVTYAYDLNNRLVETQDDLGSTTYVYDVLGRVIQHTDVHGLTVGYGYDAAGRLTSLMYPGEREMRYEYTPVGRLKKATNWLGETAEFTYDLAGRRLSQTHFNGAQTTYSYDLGGRLKSQNTVDANGAVISSYTFTLDALGQRKIEARTAPLKPMLQPTQVTYNYDPDGHRLISDGVHTYTHDDEGQLVDRSGTRQFFWDSRGRLTGLSGDLNRSFVYDDLGRRIRRTSEGAQTRYVYDVGGNLLAEVSPSGEIQKYYLYGGDLLAMVTPEGRTFDYHYDANGNTVALTDDQGAVVNRYAYTPFGLIANRLERISQPFTFVGSKGVFSEGDGLYLMRHRYYDAHLGRFISPDPMGYAGRQVNLYQYVGNNPISLKDPYGLWTFGIKADFNLFGLVEVQIAVVVDDHGDFGVAATVEKGSGDISREVSATVGATFSNADTINDMSGKSTNYTVSGSAGGFTASATQSVASDGSTVESISVSFGANTAQGLNFSKTTSFTTFLYNSSAAPKPPGGK